MNTEPLHLGKIPSEVSGSVWLLFGQHTIHNLASCVFLFKDLLFPVWGFPSGSDGKVSAHNVGDLGSIPGLGKSPGEGNTNPLQYSWGTSLVAQMVKCLSTMWETWVRSLGREKEMAIHSSTLA